MHDTLDATVKELFASSPEILGNKATVEILTSILRQSLKAQGALAYKFESREIGAAEFQDVTAAEHRRAMSSIKETIGKELFYSVFGEQGDCPEALIDPAIFKEALEYRDAAE